MDKSFRIVLGKLLLIILALGLLSLQADKVGIPMLRRPSSSLSLLYACTQCSNIFFYETTWPFIVKLHMEHPGEGGKVFINGPGHMTKMAAMPISAHIW